jgi:hypothetical protein
MRNLFEHQPIPESDLARINNSRFRKYLIYDGPHATTLEMEEVRNEVPGFPKSRIPNDMIHKLYVFPNGHGISIIRGFHSMYAWEFVVLSGCDPSLDREEVTKAYLSHKGVGIGTGGNDPRRVENWKEVEEVLKIVKEAD